MFIQVCLLSIFFVNASFLRLFAMSLFYVSFPGLVHTCIFLLTRMMCVCAFKCDCDTFLTNIGLFCMYIRLFSRSRSYTWIFLDETRVTCTCAFKWEHDTLFKHIGRFLKVHVTSLFKSACHIAFSKCIPLVSLSFSAYLSFCKVHVISLFQNAFLSLICLSVLQGGEDPQDALSS